MINRENVQQIIARSFEELMLYHNIEGIAVDHIMKNCGLARQTFYHYFRDKYDLMNWIYLQKAQAIIAEYRINNSPYYLYYHTLEFFKSKSSFFMKAIKVEGQNSFREFFYEYSLNSGIETIKSLTHKDALDEEMRFILVFFASGMLGMIETWILEGMKVSPELLAKKMCDTMPRELVPYFGLGEHMTSA